MVGSVGFVPSGISGPHDISLSLEVYVHTSLPRTMSPWHVMVVSYYSVFLSSLCSRSRIPFLSRCIIPYPQSPTHCIVVYVYIPRISMVGSVGFGPSGISGDNWTNLTKPYGSKQTQSSSETSVWQQTDFWYRCRSVFSCQDPFFQRIQWFYYNGYSEGQVISSDFYNG